MKKNYLINLLLISLIAGLYWFNTQDNSPLDDMPQLTTFISSEINTLKISRPDITDIVLEKSSVGWKITQPIKAPANNARINLLLSFLNTPSYAQINVGNNTRLNQFGLAPADILLTLNGQTIQFGGTEPISKHRYVLINNVIHLITDRITPLLKANATSFIENKLIPNGNIITKLTLPMRNADNTLSTDSITIENRDGHWQSNQKAITTDQLSAIVESWQHAYAIQVLPLTTGTQDKPTSHKIQLWYQAQPSPVELELQLTDNALFIIDRKQQLSYQFTLAILPQLVPSQAIITGIEP